MGAAEDEEKMPRFGSEHHGLLDKVKKTGITEAFANKRGISREGKVGKKQRVRGRRRDAISGKRRKSGSI